MLGRGLRHHNKSLPVVIWPTVITIIQTRCVRQVLSITGSLRIVFTCSVTPSTVNYTVPKQLSLSGLNRICRRDGLNSFSGSAYGGLFTVLPCMEVSRCRYPQPSLQSYYTSWYLSAASSKSCGDHSSSYRCRYDLCHGSVQLAIG